MRGLVEGVPHAAAAAPRRRRAPGQGGAVPGDPLCCPGPGPGPPNRAAQAGLAEAAPQGRGGPAPFSPRRRPPGPPRPVPLQLPRLSVDACGMWGGESSVQPPPPPPPPDTPAAAAPHSWGMLQRGSGDGAAKIPLPGIAHPPLVPCPLQRVTPGHQSEEFCALMPSSKRGCPSPPSPQTPVTRGQQGRVQSLQHPPRTLAGAGEVETKSVLKRNLSQFLPKKKRTWMLLSGLQHSVAGSKQELQGAPLVPHKHQPSMRAVSCSGACLPACLPAAGASCN